MHIQAQHFLAVVAALVLPFAAGAGDGVVEISHACAATGCFSGDSPGYPVVIDASAGRSYRLTSDLILPNENTTGIQINGALVSFTIDLAGFSIARVGCTGVIQGCTPGSGTGSGITGGEGVSVHNGSIMGFGRYGVVLGFQAEVSNLRVTYNHAGGILTGFAGRVSGNIVAQNNGGGIEVGYYSMVSENVVGASGSLDSDGIRAGGGSTVRGNTVSVNNRYGIFAGEGSTVTGNTAYGNSSGGISAGNGSTVAGNTVYSNSGDGINALAGSTLTGNTAFDNSGDGIDASLGSTVRSNTVRGNAQFGLRLGPNVLYRENTVTNNTTGPVTGGINRGDNYCAGTGTVSDTCP